MAERITPFLMFEGKAGEAIDFYRSIFPDSQVETLERFGAEGPGAEGTVASAVVLLNGQRLMFFDSPVPHAFTFTPAISLFVDCESTAEVDRLFAALSEGGQVMMGLGEYPFAERFAWIADRFGISWQLRFGARA